GASLRFAGPPPRPGVAGGRCPSAGRFPPPCRHPPRLRGRASGGDPPFHPGRLLPRRSRGPRVCWSRTGPGIAQRRGEAAQHRRVRGDRGGEDHSPQPAGGGDSPRRESGDDRRRCRTLPPGAGGPARGSSAERRRSRRSRPASAPAVGAQAPPGPDRRWRGARAGGPGHVVGPQHRPSGQALHRPRQLPVGGSLAPRDSGPLRWGRGRRGGTPPDPCGDPPRRAGGAHFERAADHGAVGDGTMTGALLVAVGFVVGADWRLLALAGAAVWFPFPAAAALGVVLVTRRGTRPGSLDSEVEVVEAVIGELRAGSSLRSSLLVALSDREGADRVVRRLQVGEPIPVAVAGLERALPRAGKLIQVAVGASGGAGRMLPVFEELLVHVSAAAAADSELRTALAPVRASMAVLVGGPGAYLAWAAITGRLTRLLHLPGGAILAGIGAALYLVGTAAMFFMARRRR